MAKDMVEKTQSDEKVTGRLSLAEKPLSDAVNLIFAELCSRRKSK